MDVLYAPLSPGEVTLATILAAQRGVMNALIEAAWAADAYKIMLLTGRRAEARGFYEKLGFDGNEKHGMILRKALPTE